MFEGSFSLSDNTFKCKNGSQSLVTNTVDWTGNLNSSNATANAWFAPTGAVQDISNPPSVWPSIGSAQFIWPSDSVDINGVACGDCVVEFSTPIITLTSFATPLPAALPLFASGLGGLGLLGWRRKKKKSQAVAA